MVSKGPDIARSAVPVGNLVRWQVASNRAICWSMRDVSNLIWLALVGLLRSRASLEAEILVLRHQLTVLQRKVPTRPTFRSIDRLIFSVLYRVVPGTLSALTIVNPETVIRWHRVGFRAWWRWKSRPRGGRPRTPVEIRRLIRDVSLANPLCGAFSTGGPSSV